MEWALYKIAFYKTIAQFGVAMGALVVDGKHTIVYFENGNVVMGRHHTNASTLKQVSLCGHVNPVAHD
jgi:hypothetical protein